MTKRKSAKICKQSANKPRGKPFASGTDPRRRTGKPRREARERQSYTIRFKNALANGLEPDEFAEIVIQEVRHHKPGAKEFFAVRLMGNITQPVDTTIAGTVIFQMPRPTKPEGGK